MAKDDGRTVDELLIEAASRDYLVSLEHAVVIARRRLRQVRTAVARLRVARTDATVGNCVVVGLLLFGSQRLCAFAALRRRCAISSLPLVHNRIADRS